MKNIISAKETFEAMVENADIVLLKDDVNDIASAIEKQIPKEVDTNTINKGMKVSGEYDIEFNMLCPNCKVVVGDYNVDELYFDYCPNCGQKLKWSNS